MTTVFVSGCFDVLHGGHLEFLAQAKALGDRLVVCVPTDEVIQRHKQRRPALPLSHRKHILSSLSVVDEVVVGNDLEPGLNFMTEFLRIRPHILAATEDDEYFIAKTQLCQDHSVKYVRVPKTLDYEKVSTTGIRNYIKAPHEVPLRVDFGGGWLDVPELARQGGYIVNCAVTPTVSLEKWDYKESGGLGGSAAYKFLLGEDAFASELDMGVGWQDPAIIQETGLCSWHSGAKPLLALKANPHWLKGSMALWWTGCSHHTPSYTQNPRNYFLIQEAGMKCHEALKHADISSTFKDFWAPLNEGVRLSYLAQLEEGMSRIPDVPGAPFKKYCGGGFGGYALYLFTNSGVRDNFVETTAGALAIEPYAKPLMT